MSAAHDDYKQLDLGQIVSIPPNGGPTLSPCPVCGSAASLWQYSESETAPRKLLVCCTHGEPVGPQDGLVHEGCPLYMPPENFYRETIRDAVRYWNEFATALGQLQAENAERAHGVPPASAPSSARDRIAPLLNAFGELQWRSGRGLDVDRQQIADAFEAIIAAAADPALYEAAQEFVKWAEASGHRAQPGSPVDKARAAIARVNGGAA